MKGSALFVFLLGLNSVAGAADPWNGTWVMRDTKPPMTMTLQEAGTGWKVTYKSVAPDGTSYLSTADTNLDGKDMPHVIGGKPSGQSFATRKVDGRHTFTVLKWQGKETGTSTMELSADGKTIKVDTDNKVFSPNGGTGKSTQYWDRK